MCFINNSCSEKQRGKVLYKSDRSSYPKELKIIYPDFNITIFGFRNRTRLQDFKRDSNFVSKQESPPAWTQEAHRLPRSHRKCLLFQRGGTQTWDGVPPQRWGTPPVQGWGTPCPRLGYPPVQGWGTPPPHLKLDRGTPPSKAGSEYPPIQGWIRYPPPGQGWIGIGMDRDGVPPPKSEQTDISKHNKESHHMSVVHPPPQKLNRHTPVKT